MNLIELKSFVDRAIENAIDEYGEDLKNITVSVQTDDEKSKILWSDDIKLRYDNDNMAADCVLYNWKNNN